MRVMTIDLLLNPLRLRIIHAVVDGEPFTTTQLSERLPEVSKATVYRQVAVLAEAGVLEVDGEERVRGAVERTYRLHSARAAIDTDAIGAMTSEDHQRLFAAAVGALLAEFNAYLGREGADPVADSVSYRQFSLWLSEEEKATLVRDVTARLLDLMNNRPGPERRQHMLSTILFPTDDRPAEPPISDRARPAP
jgi:DNA-binding transcriptional ArsR family regulator